mmetsp:Transcript_21592/g.42189  ORF Transcript_21592/g.42189 Transcript_21592/m.42189 type:complete len:81 (-) Transcript_21592:302-544(-)
MTWSQKIGMPQPCAWSPKTAKSTHPTKPTQHALQRPAKPREVHQLQQQQQQQQQQRQQQKPPLSGLWPPGATNVRLLGQT